MENDFLKFQSSHPYKHNPQTEQILSRENNVIISIITEKQFHNFEIQKDVEVHY